MIEAPGPVTSAQLRPGAAEQLLNLLVGSADDAPELPQPQGGGVRAAIEAVMLPALQRAPCAVSFSGGRDSSAVLALATDTARRHGLAPPIPVMMRFPGAAGTDETAYQDLVLQHLQLVDQAVIVDARADFDALGQVGASVLAEHGIIWPANAYMHLPVMRQLRGGSLLTGFGGDELFDDAATRSGWRQRAIDALPPRLQEPLWRRLRSPAGWEWLTPKGRRLALGAFARDRAQWPPAWAPSIRYWVRTRSYRGITGAVRLLGEPFDIKVIHPLIEPAVLAEHVRSGGFANRTSAMRHLTGDLLPDEVVRRTTKAQFSSPLWGPATLGFIAHWAGEGVDRRLVDIDRLRAEFQKTQPDFRTLMLLQSAWLSHQGLGN